MPIVINKVTHVVHCSILEQALPKYFVVLPKADINLANFLADANAEAHSIPIEVGASIDGVRLVPSYAKAMGDPPNQLATILHLFHLVVVVFELLTPLLQDVEFFLGTTQENIMSYLPLLDELFDLCAAREIIGLNIHEALLYPVQILLQSDKLIQEPLGCGLIALALGGRGHCLVAFTLLAMLVSITRLELLFLLFLI